MILACPNCSARFLVADHAVGVRGRAVRCGRCDHVWFAAPSPEIGGLAGERQDDGPPPTPEPAGPSAGKADNGDSTPSPGGAGDLRTDKPIGRPQLPVLRRERSRWPRRIAWIAVVAAAIGLVAGASWHYRAQIATRLPDAGRLYAAIGIRALPLGSGLRLTIDESVNAVRNGTAVLTVRGRVENMTARARRLPGLRGALFNEFEHEVQHWTIPIPATSLAPEEEVAFKTELMNPSKDAVRISITFHEPGKNVGH